MRAITVSTHSDFHPQSKHGDPAIKMGMSRPDGKKIGSGFFTKRFSEAAVKINLLLGVQKAPCIVVFSAKTFSSKVNKLTNPAPQSTLQSSQGE